MPESTTDSAQGRARRNQVFARILFTFIAIVVVIDGLAVGIFLTGSRIVRSQVREAMLSQISFYVDSLTASIERAYGLQLDLVNDDRFARIAVIPESFSEYERFRIVRDVEAKLTSVRSSSDFIADVVVYLPGTGTRISAGMTEGAVPSSDWERLLVGYSAGALIQPVDGRLYVLFAHPTGHLSPRSDRPPSFLSVVELSPDRLADLLPVLPESGNVRAWFFGTDRFWRIAGAGDSGSSNGDREAFERLIQDRIASGVSADLFTATVRGRSVGVAYAHSRTLGACLAWEFDVTALLPVRRPLLLLFVTLVVVSLCGVPVLSMMVYRLVHVPVLELVSSLAELERGNLGFHAEYAGRNEFEYLRRAFNSMSTRLSHLFDEVYHQRVLVRESELRALQARINPHFLYNSLFVLYRIIQSGERESAAIFTNDLARYYQVLTRDAGTEVSLARDLEHACVYCNIQRVRGGGRIRTEVDELPHEVAMLPLPPLTIQPIVENCYSHAFADAEDGGVIRIRADRSDVGWVLTIEDDGSVSDETIARLNEAMVEPRSGAQEKMSALYNIHRRMQALYGRAGGLSFRRAAGGGLAVDLHLIRE